MNTLINCCSDVMWSRQSFLLGCGRVLELSLLPLSSLLLLLLVHLSLALLVNLSVDPASSAVATNQLFQRQAHPPPSQFAVAVSRPCLLTRDLGSGGEMRELDVGRKLVDRLAAWTGAANELFREIAFVQGQRIFARARLQSVRSGREPLGQLELALVRTRRRRRRC